MTRMSPPTDIRRAPRGTFVQTDRASHEAWAQLTARKPAASAVLHLLSASIGNQNAVVVSQKTMAKILSVTDRTIRNAISDLEAGNWLQVVRIGAGRECAYILNDRVAWADKRDNLRLSRFSAEVIADAEDQTDLTLSDEDLRKLPRMGEVQLPAGTGLPPVSQPFFDGLEPELPTTGKQRD
ncbi:HTH domain-containing protein [Paracoccus marcusii]|uniref:HTH domain-containing protein n=1 Tax=Paracoccus marcusii TaxID=59779 RepID=UPI0024918C27|nr:HTH domain-containing protein [Paracoccus marcusii]